MKNDDIFNLFKNKHIQILSVIFIIGIVLMISFGGKNDEKKAEISADKVMTSDEDRLSNILSEIRGAGRVSVMITYYGTAEKDIAYEIKKNSMGDNEQTEQSEDKKAVMTGDEPMVVKETYPKVKGVIVAAEGADNVSVRQAISEGVTAVLDVPAHRVCIYKKED